VLSYHSYVFCEFAITQPRRVILCYFMFSVGLRLRNQGGQFYAILCFLLVCDYATWDGNFGLFYVFCWFAITQP